MLFLTNKTCADRNTAQESCVESFIRRSIVNTRKLLKLCSGLDRRGDIFMQRVKLDRIDRRILRDLQEDGRMTNVELAERAGISAPPCLRRVKALERAGFIRGYHADVNSEKLGFSVIIFAFVGLSSQSETDLLAFEEMIEDWEEVRECHMLSGETDFLLKIVARDWDEFQKFLTGKLTPAPNVSNVKTALAFRTKKQKPGVPIDDNVTNGTKDH